MARPGPVSVKQSLPPDAAQWLQGAVGNAATARLLRREADARPDIDRRKARRYNRRRPYSAALIEQIEAAVGAPIDGRLSSKDAETVADWQFENGARVDGMVGPKTLGALGLKDGEVDASGGDAQPHAETPAPAPVEEAEPEPAQEPSEDDSADSSVDDDADAAKIPEGAEAFEKAARESIENIASKDSHLDRSDALVEAARKYASLYPELVKRYVAQPEPDAIEKVRVLGEAAAAIARMEMLLGTIRHEGGSWERVIKKKVKGKDGKTKTKTIKNSNRGDFVDYFSGGNARKPNEKVGPWCTRFATGAYKALTGVRGLQASSGYKVANPDEFKGLKLDYSEDEGGAFAGATSGSKAASTEEGGSNYNPWQRLEKELRKLDADKRKEHAEAFLAENLTPQAGDTVVIARGGATTGAFKKYLSHTLMVERQSGLQMSLVEGNIAGRGTGRTFDLSDPDDVGRIVLVARPSLDAYGLGGEPTADPTKPDAATDEITANDLKAPITYINSELLDVAKAGGWVKKSSKSGDVVADIVTWGEGGSET